MTVGLDDFHYFIDIFDNWPSRACIFDIKITGTESTETKIARYWLLQYQDHKHYSHFQPPGLRFRLYRRKTVKYGVFFSLLVSIFDTRSNNTDSSNHKTVWEVFFSTKSYLSNAIWRNPIALIQREIQITTAIYWKNNKFLFTTPNISIVFYSFLDTLVWIFYTWFLMSFYYIFLLFFIRFPVC